MNKDTDLRAALAQLALTAPKADVTADAFARIYVDEDDSTTSLNAEECATAFGSLEGVDALRDQLGIGNYGEDTLTFRGIDIPDAVMDVLEELFVQIDEA